MIRLINLHKSYPIGKESLHVLKGINLHIKEGEFVSIMGSSGSGKSTLLNIVGLLDGHDEGEYYLNGQLIENLDEKNKQEEDLDQESMEDEWMPDIEEIKKEASFDKDKNDKISDDLRM